MDSFILQQPGEASTSIARYMNPNSSEYLMILNILVTSIRTTITIMKFKIFVYYRKREREHKLAS